MKIHLLSGFLGSGKTTAIQQACAALLRGGVKTAVIMNDQGIQLVDSGLFKSLGIPWGQVVNGCFCCNYNDLDLTIQSLIETHQPDVIFAESVGSCTDLIATVAKPLTQFRNDTVITVCAFADIRLLEMMLRKNGASFDPEVAYIYFKQLEESRIIVLTRSDLVSQEKVQEVKQLLAKKYSGKIVLEQNSFNEADIMRWLNTLDEQAAIAELPSLNIDYETYGAGEARLGWLDEELEIQTATPNAFSAAHAFMHELRTLIKKKGYPIGHLKFLVNGDIKISFTSPGPTAADIHLPDMAIDKVFVLINARVQTSPQNLSDLVAAAAAFIEKEFFCTITSKSHSAFRPGFPRPAHRIANVPAN